MAFAFKQIEAHDPNNPGLVAPNASVTIFEPGDPAKTPLTITTLTGEALPNPVTVNGLGYGPAFMHATLSQVAWSGGGLTGTFESYEGMRDEAIAARDAANTAAANAAAEAQAAIGDATAAAEAAADAADASALAAANSAALVGAPADNAIATAINASGSATKAALSATILDQIESEATDSESVLSEVFSPPVNAIQEFMGKVRNGVRDLNIMIVGDSTAAANTSTPGIPLGSWAYRLPAKLAALIPTHTIDFRQFNDGAPGSYGAATTTAGSGTQKITIWNAAVAGKTWEYFLDSTRAATMLSAPAADLILIDNGHNDNLAALQAGTDGPQKSKAYLAIEQIRTLNPDAAVVLMSQNAIAGAYPKASQYRADMYRLMARKRGWGFIDICHAFVTDGRPLSDLLSADNLHPSDAGYELWANEVMKYFRARPTSQQIPALPPAFTQYARNYAKNNGFNQFDAPPVLTSWTASNATLSKDTAVFETGTYSVKLKKAATGDSYMEQALPTADMRGKTVTFLVRMRIASGNSGSAGQITIRHDAASAASEVWAQMDQWFWRSVTIKFTSGANNPYVRIIVDPNAGSSALTEINVDRVAVVLGEVPADFDYTAI